MELVSRHFPKEVKRVSEGALRAVVVGCRMGAIHARILAQLDEFDLVAVCDLDELTAQKVAAETGAPRIYTDYATMLKRERPEVVAIATPTALHAAMTFQAIEAGVRGICCEKPMATNLADGREMVERCRKKGIALVVNHQRRMGADLVAMREAVGAGRHRRVARHPRPLRRRFAFRRDARR
jgi:predicted dehydrogenase